MRGHSLVELTEHDNSAAGIMVHSMYIYICTFKRITLNASRPSEHPPVRGEKYQNV